MNAIKTLVVLFIVSTSALAQPVRIDKWVANVQKIPAERIKDCANGCYVLTTAELAGALKNAADLSATRTRQSLQQSNK